MKKILFIFLFCLIKLNAYEYIIYERENYYLKQIIYYDKNGDIWDKYVKEDGSLQSDNLLNENSAYQHLGYIVINGVGLGKGYCSKLEFYNYFKNDLIFLNALYNQITMPFLNFLYNNKMTNVSHVLYENYEILYNSDGLAVESCVDGVYAGLYNMDEMQFSGNLYNESGDLVLVNGVEPSFFQVLCDKLIGDLHLKMLDAEDLIDKGWIFAVAFTLAIFYLIARTLKRVLIGKNSKGVENES